MCLAIVLVAGTLCYIGGFSRALHRRFLWLSIPAGSVIGLLVVGQFACFFGAAIVGTLCGFSGFFDRERAAVDVSRPG